VQCGHFASLPGHQGSPFPPRNMAVVGGTMVVMAGEGEVGMGGDSCLGTVVKPAVRIRQEAD
jgi:hypothetical protein